MKTLNEAVIERPNNRQLAYLKKSIENCDPSSIDKEVLFDWAIADLRGYCDGERFGENERMTFRKIVGSISWKINNNSYRVPVAFTKDKIKTAENYQKMKRLDLENRLSEIPKRFTHQEILLASYGWILPK